MPSADDLANFSRLKTTGLERTLQIIPPYPKLVPDDPKARVLTFHEHDRKVEEWRVKANIAILGGKT